MLLILHSAAPDHREVVSGVWSDVQKVAGRTKGMFESGQKRRFGRLPMTSGLPPSTDIFRAGQHVSKVPIPEVVTSRLIPHHTFAGVGARHARDTRPRRWRRLTSR